MTMSDVAGEYISDRGPAEVWAVAEAVYDETQSKLVLLFGSSIPHNSSFKTPERSHGGG